jgi:regulation of enolase protein 1 (concanavalin A-like superfamily)
MSSSFGASGEENMKSRMMKYIGTLGLLLWLTSALAVGQTTLSIPGIPGTLNWQNTPRSSNTDSKNVLTISSSPKSDWFVDPFDGTVGNSAPILFFTPGSDYVLSARATVKFATKWDAGALMLMGDDHHWAKLSYEYSPDGKPTLVTVVTRGLSDDCNSMNASGDSVYLRIAKSSRTYVFYFPMDGQNWQILRTFSLDTELPVRVGFESQFARGIRSGCEFLRHQLRSSSHWQYL